MPALSQNQIDFISACYKEGRNTCETARLVPCSPSTVWWYYQDLNNGIQPKAYDYRRAQPTINKRFGPKPKPIPKVKRPLNDDKRFYHSTFEPS